MAEEKAAPKKEKKAAPAADAADQVHEIKKRESKASRWTLEACMKAAKRFDTVDAWSKGFPSSYKAAVARGFDKQCMAHMTSGKATVKKVAPAAAKKAAPAPKKLPRAG